MIRNVLVDKMDIYIYSDINDNIFYLRGYSFLFPSLAAPLITNLLQ